MGNTATNATEPDATLCSGASFHQPLCGGALVGIHLEVFGLDIDGDVLSVVFILDLGTDDPLEHLLTALCKLRCFFGHGTVEDCGMRASLRSYAGGLVSFLKVSNGAE
jgi:hypothetical protein